MNSKAFLGIDVSKGYADFILLDAQCGVVEPSFQLADDKAGRKQLGDLVATWRAKGFTKIYCGVESTGGYENNWYSYLKSLQVTGHLCVCRLNPSAVKGITKAALSRSTTDVISAIHIASYLIKFPEQIDYGVDRIEDNRFKEARLHLVLIKMHQKQKVQLSNQLEKLLYQYFPVILIYCRHGVPVWLLRMLVKYPTASAVIKAGSRLSKIKGISQAKATSLITKAKNDEASTNEAIAHMISFSAREVLHRVDVIEDEKKLLVSAYKHLNEVQLLVSIPGVGLESAVEMALEIEDVIRFDTAKKIASYFGVHPTKKQSGDGEWRSRISKKGRGAVRARLYMCTLSAVRFNPVLKTVYGRLRARGMNHGQASGAVMHKLLRIMYGMLKTGKPFDAQVDLDNQKRSVEKQEKIEAECKAENKKNRKSLHRFAEVSLDAPISRRKAQKTKKQIASQASLNEVNTGLLPAMQT